MPRPKPSGQLDLFPSPATVAGVTARLENLRRRIALMNATSEDCYLLAGAVSRLALVVDELEAFTRRRAAFAATAVMPATPSTLTCAAPASVSVSAPLSMPPSIARPTTRRRRATAS